MPKTPVHDLEATCESSPASDWRTSNGKRPIPEETSQYAGLKRMLREKGLFEKQPRYYAIKIFLTLGLLIPALLFLFVVKSFALQLLNAVYLAFVSTQLGLLGHDAGHRQIFYDRWKNRILGLILGNVLLGISHAYWTEKHDKHHNNPNQLDVDPDIDIPVLVFVEQDIPKKSKLAYSIIRYQHLFFFPMLALTFVDLVRQSLQFLWQKRSKKHLRLEIVLIGLHLAGYCDLLFSRFEFWQAMLFILVHQGLTGVYMGSIFAPNHKGMRLIANDEKLDFLHRQVETARNVKAHPITDFWYGGLNYQIEHHLFPIMPRNKLRDAQIIIRTFCHEHGIPYTETGFLQSYKDILHHLRKVSAPLRGYTGENEHLHSLRG